MLEVYSPLNYIGGKYASATRIVSLFPESSRYNRFVDVCGGAAWVTCAKLPFHHEEIYNDLDGNLVNFWRMIQTHADVMQTRLENMIYAREFYYEFYRSLFDGTQLEPLERAIRYFYVLRGTGTGWIRKSPVGWDYRTKKVRSFHSAINLFSEVQQRFRYISVDNRDVLDTIGRYEDPRALLYLDPPYFGAEKYYETSKNGFPHEEMATLLNQAKGFVAVSYYPHESLDMLYPPEKWYRTTWEQPKLSNIQSEKMATATEMLLTNYKPEKLQYELLWEV